VGDKCVPGDTIAEIETDKASMAFEGQDEFYIAKLLIAAGGEVTVGSPILITVEDESLVSAFESYKVEAPVAPAVVAPVATTQSVTPTPNPVVVAPQQPVVSTPTAAPAVSTPALATPAASSTHASPAVPALGMYSVRVPGSVNTSSPLAGKIRADQAAYSIKYGRTVLVQADSKKGK